ncbi:hypothetical protein RS030_243566 [Cryptosporidium xiaoi]|uniref:RRM domain-containing protein n=1 Tax=Cryptosporidium xiaoi TaxID=659607 RepID=A0AAV9XZT2_9CRYT
MSRNVNENRQFDLYRNKRKKKSTISKINEKVVDYESSNGVNYTSWHDEYKNSSYIYIGGLDLGLTEGDIVTVFSQWGEPIDVNLIRDAKTGLSKGYCFLCYEDQRSTVLAVDNANDMKLLDKTIKVDHVKDYRPKTNNNSNYKLSGPEGGGIGIYGITQDVRNKYNKELEALKEINLGNLNVESNIKYKINNFNDQSESTNNKLLKKSHFICKKRVKSLSRSLSQ